MTDEIKQCRKALLISIMGMIQPKSRKDIPELLNEIDVPKAPDDEKFTKREYVDSRINRIKDTQLSSIASIFLKNYKDALLKWERFNLEELFWTTYPDPSSVRISKKARYDIARALLNDSLYINKERFLDLARRYWEKEDCSWGEIFNLNFSSSLDNAEKISEIEKCLLSFTEEIDKWTVEKFLEQMGAFDCSDFRFTSFFESLVSYHVCPKEDSQHELAFKINDAISKFGLEFKKIREEEGFPCFEFLTAGRINIKPKNLIFASLEKPDIRLLDAVNNHLEIMNEADKVLIYDRDFPAHGLSWKDLQDWWSDFNNLKDKNESKNSLYRRLFSSLPENSLPQKLFFKTFFKTFRKDIQRLPALLPEVWLHWDHVIIPKRREAALPRFRMDFLMLFPKNIRVVIEVDGKHHYTDENGNACSKTYAKMVSADRDLILAGYEVYRFSTSELNKNTYEKIVTDFFTRLFELHNCKV